MNIKIIITVFLLLLLGLVFFYMKNTGNNTQTEQQNNAQEISKTSMNSIQTAGAFEVLVSASNITWTAGKPNIIGYQHNGTMTLKEGTLNFNDSAITGAFTIDMTQLKVTSLGGGKAGNESRLESHLKTGDFFNVEAYPESRFVISQTKKESDGSYTVTGNLTMKNITNEITFPANISENDTGVILEAEFSIDRTKWDITFGSASFFDNLAENAIGDEVTLKLEIKATKE